MSDRELLEQAAKAAGIAGEYLRYWGDSGINTGDPDNGLWNPLEDDGDALRLAVKLDLLPSPRVAHEIAVERFTRNADKLTATRRAIVRAAAAMAQEQKP